MVLDRRDLQYLGGKNYEFAGIVTTALHLRALQALCEMEGDEHVVPILRRSTSGRYCCLSC